MKITKVSFGIASNLGNEIIIHKSLFEPKWTSLKLWILRHEEQHALGKYVIQDFIHDLKTPLWVQKQTMLFCLEHPTALAQYIPIWHYRGEWTIDWSTTILLVVFTVAIIEITIHVWH